MLLDAKKQLLQLRHQLAVKTQDANKEHIVTDNVFYISYTEISNVHSPILNITLSACLYSTPLVRRKWRKGIRPALIKVESRTENLVWYVVSCVYTIYCKGSSKWKSQSMSQITIENYCIVDNCRPWNKWEKENKQYNAQ